MGLSVRDVLEKVESQHHTDHVDAFKRTTAVSNWGEAASVDLVPHLNRLVEDGLVDELILYVPRHEEVISGDDKRKWVCSKASPAGNFLVLGLGGARLS